MLQSGLKPQKSKKHTQIRTFVSHKHKKYSSSLLKDLLLHFSNPLCSACMVHIFKVNTMVDCKFNALISVTWQPY